MTKSVTKKIKIPARVRELRVQNPRRVCMRDAEGSVVCEDIFTYRGPTQFSANLPVPPRAATVEVDCDSYEWLPR